MLKDNLRRLRLTRGISCEDIANAMQITVRRIYSYESGEAEPDLELLSNMAEYLNVPLDVLLADQNDDERLSEEYNLTLVKFGYRLKQFREEQGLDAKDVAKTAGITRQYLLSVENGSRIPKLETAIKIMNAIGISADNAFMDTVVSSHVARACYLEERLLKLSPARQRLLLDLIESTIRALEKAK